MEPPAAQHANVYRRSPTNYCHLKVRASIHKHKTATIVVLMDLLHRKDLKIKQKSNFSMHCCYKLLLITAFITCRIYYIWSSLIFLKHYSHLALQPSWAHCSNSPFCLFMSCKSQANKMVCPCSRKWIKRTRLRYQLACLFLLPEIKKEHLNGMMPRSKPCYLKNNPAIFSSVKSKKKQYTKRFPLSINMTYKQGLYLLKRVSRLT